MKGSKMQNRTNMPFILPEENMVMLLTTAPEVECHGAGCSVRTD